MRKKATHIGIDICVPNSDHTITKIIASGDKSNELIIDTEKQKRTEVLKQDFSEWLEYYFPNYKTSKDLKPKAQ